uniref:Farnesoic acid O-methyl transferase domain-containing protein n=1 Tax=Megaselia scalaris TaxID=36166 RepID=T1GV32_MEGSC
MGCNESPDFRPLDLTNDFTHNRPKKNEVIRTRMYFIGEDPLMSVTANTEYNFGHFNGVENFAIYLKYKDWLKQNPNYCTIAKNVSFHRNYYTRMDVVLTKSGDFTVFAYGKSGFTITCRTNVLIDTWTRIKVRITSHARNRGKFYYDCPMK